MIMQFSRPHSFFTVGLLLIMGSFFGCSDLGTNPDDDNNGTPSDNVSFSADIQPIFNSNCTGCHGNSGGLSLSSYSGLMAGGDNGATVTAGNGASSILVQKLSSDPPFGDQMPLGTAALSDENIALITIWINEGAENN